MNPNSRTLNLSEHMTKERRHKEASLSDVVNVVAGPPEKYKVEEGEDEAMYENRCMSVKFVRGGAIDLRFKTEAERDMWYDAVTKLVLNQSSDTLGGKF